MMASSKLVCDFISTHVALALDVLSISTGTTD